uniref:Large ribosomal subunit protein uL6c n=1 Tax=Characiopsis acuta TaxID=2040456 RepID=A0A3R5QLA9_9STRA|nr:ribosomal protein L6 [Characiopsis acuta]QAA11251.1 ribosomal protein L6 [Characiopsis acuta]
MSRIGKQIIKIPAGVSIKLTDETIQVNGPKGDIGRQIPSCLSLVEKEGSLQIQRKNEAISSRQIHGLFRSLVSNMVVGTSQGFTKTLELKGVGYKANIDKKILNLSVGYSHPVRIEPPAGIELAVENNTTIKVTGIDKEKVGLIAQQIRSIKPPEPYKGKGILYKGEVVQLKVGKSSK